MVRWNNRPLLHQKQLRFPLQTALSLVLVKMHHTRRYFWARIGSDFVSCSREDLDSRFLTLSCAEQNSSTMALLSHSSQTLSDSYCYWLCSVLCDVSCCLDYLVWGKFLFLNGISEVCIAYVTRNHLNQTHCLARCIFYSWLQHPSNQFHRRLIRTLDHR